jgi:hypothetical protein
MISSQSVPPSPSRIMLISFALFALGSLGAQAQTNAVASKTMDISIFGGYQNLHPDYGHYRDNGFVVGADVTRYLKSKVDPSLEVRYNYATNAYVTEKSFEAGIRAQGDYGRFHPYADFLGGIATINFAPFVAPPGTTSINGGTFSIGGGADFDVYRRLQLKIDYQQQYMYFGNMTLTPRPVSVGIAYRIPFRPQTRN